MKKSVLFFVFIFLAGFSFAQLSGTKTIPGDYTTIASAIAALNTSGVGAGGVIFNVAADYTETIAVPLSITATGTLANPIIFQKSGAGANPLITAYTGAATPASAMQDGMWNLVGSDYVTIDGISLTDPNTGSPATMEYGYAMFKASTSNGCRYNTIKNCVVTLNRNNITIGTAPAVDGSRAINIMNSLVTTQATILVPAGSTGTNSYNSFYSNTLQNCNIGIALIGYAGVTPFATCDFGNDIGGTSLVTGNSILNFGGGAGATTANAAAGVRTLAQYDLNVSYNTVNNNNGSGINHTGPMRGIYINLAITASENITNNTLSITTGATNSATSCIETGSGGTAGTNTININNNTMTGGSTTLTTGNFYGIWNSLVTGTVNINSNTISGILTSGTGILYGIVAGLPVSLVINNNTIANFTRTGNGRITGMITNAHIICQNNLIDGLICTAPASTSAIYGIMDNVQTATTGESYISNTIRNISSTGTAVINGIFTAAVVNATGNKTIQNNQLYNFTIAGGGTIYGIIKQNGTNDTISGNQVHDLSITGPVSGTINGIRSASGATNSIFKNNIYALSCAGGSSGSVAGMYIETGTTNNIYRNNLYNLSSASTNPGLSGVYLAGGVTNNFYNNFISDLRTPAANAGLVQLAGIYVAGGTNSNVFYNSVYLNGTSTGAPFGSAALYASTDPWLMMKNNILVNATTPTGSGIAAAYCRNGTSLTHYAAGSDNNDLYAGAGSASNLIFYDGTNSDMALDAYKTRVAPLDGLSVTELPPFVNTGAAPYDLHLQTTVQTVCESGGATVTIPDVAFDYDNNVRYPNLGYPNNPLSPASGPDIGADEFAGLSFDKIPPVIFLTPLINTASSTARNLAVTITDISGIPASGTGLPRLYWRINTGTWNSVTGTFVSGSVYNFSFGAGALLNDVVSYYIVARDMATTPNVGSSPSAGATGFTANPPACSTPPSSPFAYTIIEGICGTFNVGAGGTYPTLTAAIADVNSKAITCPVTLLLTDASYSASETFPVTINVNPGSGAVNTLTIKTAAGNNTTITGSVNNGSLIRVLNSNTIIDGSNIAGGTTRNLTISNTSTTVPGTVLIGSAGTIAVTNVTLENCTVINGINSATAVNVSDGALEGAAGYFNNITIRNNSVQQAYTGISCIAENVAGNGSGLLVDGNDMTTAGANSIRLTGIYLQGVDGCTVSNNLIGNMANTDETANLTGIRVAAGTVNAVISGNTISAVTGTLAGPTGIVVASARVNANINVTDNIITGLSTGAPTEVYGIYLNSAISGCTIQKNVISDIKNSHPAGYSATGIALASTLAAANTTLKNNVIYDVAGYGFSNWQRDNGYGINIMIGGGYNLYFNTVHLSTDQTLPGGVPACLMIGAAVTTANSLDLRNNIFVIDATVGDMLLAVMCNAYKTVFSHIDYNVYFSSGQFFGDFVLIGNSHRLCSTMADFQTQSGQDVHSVNMKVDFVSPSSQVPTTPALSHLGNFLTTVMIDFNNVSRTNPPDMGAYEFSKNPLLATTAATAVMGAGSTLNGTVNPADLNVSLYFDYGLNTTYGTTVSGTPPAASGIISVPVSATVTGLSENTAYHFRLRGVTSSNVTVYGNDMTFNTGSALPGDLAVTSTISNDTCFNATNTITVAGTPNTFVVTPAGNVTMVAGVNILYFPGTIVQPGGYLHGYISTGTYCGAATSPMAAMVEGQDENLFNINQVNFTIYPNPTTGNFTLVQKGGKLYGNVKVEVFSMRGEKVMTETIIGEKMHDFRFSGMATGLYFVKVVADGYVETMKLVKL
ncbi:MAG: T9SS type A sorting domain-containing protein [Bacteroidetes bacterium]|nr:T9SS type A sorting domain-containing protein [Bacteroidota bacterium]